MCSLQQKSQNMDMALKSRVSEYGYDLEIKGQSQIFLKTVTLLVIQTPLWCIDGMCSNLAQNCV